MTTKDKAIAGAHKTVNAIPVNGKGKDIIPGLSVETKEKDPVKAIELYMVANGLSLKRSVELKRIMLKHKDNVPEMKAQVNRILNIKFFPDVPTTKQTIEL